jgi:hypothetical protein
MISHCWALYSLEGRALWQRVQFSDQSCVPDLPGGDESEAATFSLADGCVVAFCAHPIDIVIAAIAATA